MNDPLSDFTRFGFRHEGKTRTVLKSGAGPAVVVIHEVPGITPQVADFGRRVVAAGLTVYMPSLLGTPGRPLSIPYVLRSMVGACVSREFATFALNRTSPVTGWLRALARRAHEECGGPGVGAVGMCLTGGFALAMMVDDRMLAPVLSQPSLPFPLGKKRKSALGISDRDLARVKQRGEQGACVLGLRFTNDPFVPGERFDRLRRELGEHFLAVEIDSSAGNPYGNPRAAHSVLTVHLVDKPGHPTRDALERVIAFFAENLQLPVAAG